MKTRFAKVLVLLTLVVSMVAMMAIPAMAVTITGVPGLELSCSNTSEGSIAETSSGIITATVKGGNFLSKENTITIRNTSSKKAELVVDYTVSGQSGFKVNNSASNSTSGTLTVVLAADKTATFYITAAKKKTATLTLSNFSLTPVAEVVNTTIQYDSSCGSVTVEGSAVASGTTQEVSSSTGVALAATAKSGCTFLGWINTADCSVVSKEANFQLIPDADVTVKAVFINENSNAWFWASGTSYLFDDLNEASTFAKTADNKTVVLAHNGTLSAGSYTVDSGVTLLIPYNESNTLCTGKPTQVKTYAKPTAYRTLTMAANAEITVNGAISLSGQQTGKYGQNGMPTGPISFVKMNSGSKITVNSGAKLYAWGFITGSGAVEVMSGGTVYECFQVADFRGGDGTTQVVAKDDECGVFPFTQYYVQNIEVPMTLHAGAVENGYFSAIISGMNQSSDVPFIGTSGTMFVIQDGYVVKDYLEGTGRMDIKLNGDVSLSPMTLSTSGTFMGIGKITVASEKYALPITNHMNVTLESGTVTLYQNIALLPGAKFYINEGSNFVLGSGNKIYVYDYDEWTYTDDADTLCGHAGAANKVYVQAAYVPGGDGVVGRTDDALVEVNGTIDVAAGEIYCTPGGANVYSTGKGVIKLTPGVATSVFNATQSVDSNGDQKITFVEIPVKAPVLKNADGTTVDATEAGEYAYYASTGRWDRPSHYYEATVVAPTCTEKGYTKHTCAVCGGSHNDTEVDALGHTEVIDAAVAATCTENGKTEGKHCSVCGEVTVAQGIVEALDHNGVVDAAVEATCTAAGKTEGVHCDRCGETLVAQEEIAALGHTEVIDEGKEATCNEKGLTEGKHCKTCGEVFVAQEEIAALGHTEVIDKAVAATCTAAGKTEGKHCSVCGEVIIAQEEVSALGHSYGNWVVTAPSYTAAGSQTKTCSTCGDVVTEELEKLANPVTGWNITLKDNIGVNFVMDLTETDKVKVTVNGDEVEFTQENGKFSINVAAAQMMDEIAVSVNGLPLANTYSVRGYADKILADPALSACHDLVKNMLVYGGAAQTYFGYNTGKLASNNIKVDAVVPTGDSAVEISDSLSAISFYGATLVHETKTAVRFYFTGSVEGLTFTANGEPVSVDMKNDMYYVEIADINPQDLGNDVKVVVSDGTNDLTVAYSPLDYIVRIFNKAGASAALVQAMYGYYLAADAYTAA